MNNIISFLTVVCAALLVWPVHAETGGEHGAQAVFGYWMTEDRDGIVEIYPCGDRACGRFRWLKDDSSDNPSLDDRNPDPALRKRPLCGLQFMGGFEPDGQNGFKNGWIYSIRHGSTFSANLLSKSQDELELRGYVFIPLLGGSQTWRRTGPEPACLTEERADPASPDTFHTPFNPFE